MRKLWGEGAVACQKFQLDGKGGGDGREWGEWEDGDGGKKYIYSIQKNVPVNIILTIFIVQLLK